MDPAIDAEDAADASREDLVRALHAHLRATERLPIDPTANRWLGEAQAAAADVADGTAPASVVRERAGQVVHLLENAGDTEHPEAEAHVEAALAIARELVARDPDGG